MKVKELPFSFVIKYINIRMSNVMKNKGKVLHNFVVHKVS